MSLKNHLPYKLLKSIRTLIFALFILTDIINANNQNIINTHTLNNFFDNDKSIEICGDKYLARTKSGEVLLSSDLGYNWSKLNIGKISKIISFENTEINKSREKLKNGNKFNFEFLKNLLAKKIKKENLEHEIKLNIAEENIVFINDEGKILFSKNCGFEFLNNVEKYQNEFNSALDKKVIVKDFVFHPFNQQKGIVIAYDDESRIFEDFAEKKLIQIFLTENFGKNFRKIQSINNEELQKYYDFTW